MAERLDFIGSRIFVDMEIFKGFYCFFVIVDFLFILVVDNYGFGRGLLACLMAWNIFVESGAFSISVAISSTNSAVFKLEWCLI